MQRESILRKLIKYVIKSTVADINAFMHICGIIFTKLTACVRSWKGGGQGRGIIWTRFFFWELCHGTSHMLCEEAQKLNETAFFFEHNETAF